ncbi:signal peptidase I [Nonomuraea rhodomycinica]|uniref:Signal peptidase I n=1 Tax=Nonomuraea rhodomycinica TaxID=1712872 RepID=A0A7Y6MF98_9ACTN|nr:signal peptidase I [Nonomuraea rhodomycinica]NUW44461.1 signal peptidase I [Nonomuraea rhodomycinica]
MHIAPACGLAAAAVAAAVAWGGLALRRRLLVITVIGRSMEPTYAPGTRLLARRTSDVSRLRRGDVVVLRSPAAERPVSVRVPTADGRTVVAGSTPVTDLVVKRVHALPGDPVPRARVPALAHVEEETVPAGRIVVLGDNPEESVDSRRYGYLAADTLVAVVIRALQGQTAPGSSGRT